MKMMWVLIALFVVVRLGFLARYSGPNATVGGYFDHFALFDAPAPGGNLVNGTNLLAVLVTNGLFTADLDFGPGAFAGEAR